MLLDVDILPLKRILKTGIIVMLIEKDLLVSYQFYMVVNVADLAKVS